MLSPLYSSRRQLAALAAFALAFQLSLPLALAKSAALSTSRAMEEVHLTADESLLAHHGGEGATAAAAIGNASAAPVLGVLNGRVSKKSYSDSLWGNMLLGMAYARDPELQKLERRLGQVNTLTMLSVFGVSGLSLAQNIHAFNQTTEPQSIDVTPAHHPGGHDHVHIPAEKIDRTPSTIGMIGSGVTLGALGLRAVFGKVYATKMMNRQVEIRKNIDSILERLEQGVAIASVQPDLNTLIGERAGSEFLMLWRAIHPNAQ